MHLCGRSYPLQRHLDNLCLRRYVDLKHLGNLCHCTYPVYVHLDYLDIGTAASVDGQSAAVAGVSCSAIPAPLKSHLRSRPLEQTASQSLLRTYVPLLASTVLCVSLLRTYVPSLA